MSKLGELTLIHHLVDAESLDTIAREGLDPDFMPTEGLRPVLVFALEYFHSSGRTRAPSEAALRQEFGPLFDDEEIEFTDPEDTVEWALDDLKGSHAHMETQRFVREFSKDMAGAEAQAHKIDVVMRYRGELDRVAMSLISREERSEFTADFSERVQSYEIRQENRDAFTGMRLGLQPIDAYTFGVHPGEVAVLAAGPKTGKSYLLDMVALREWEAGRVTVLFTLENSIEMTLDRIGCMAQGVSAKRWQQGLCTPDEYERVRKWEEEAVRSSDTHLWVLQPSPGNRGIESLVRQAQLLEAESLLIDQLTFVEVPDRDVQRPRNEQVRNIMHTLKAMVTTGRDRVPVLIAHQVTREGLKAAAKSGYLEMHHLAESSEVERTSDWVFSIYQSRVAREGKQALFQTLASRRADMRHFDLRWDVDGGQIAVMRERENLT